MPDGGNNVNKHLTARPHSKTPSPGISPTCQARLIVAPDLVDCLVNPLVHCQYRLYFGTSHYCTHPQKVQIAALTAAEGDHTKK